MGMATGSLGSFQQVQSPYVCQTINTRVDSLGGMTENRQGKVSSRSSSLRSKAAGGQSKGFSAEERAALRDTAQERAMVWGKNLAEDERVVLAKIAQMPEPDRSQGSRVHTLIRTHAPSLAPRLWYGMPAYTKAGKVLCFYQPASKFKVRYGTLGFSDEARLDDGLMWPITYALTELTPEVEAKIVSLVKKAIG